MSEMISGITTFDDDDRDFLQEINRLVCGVVALHAPKQFLVCRINNWFGDKWLGFAGKTLGALGIHDYRRMIIPPFVPNRVTSQALFKRMEDGIYIFDGHGPMIHQKQPASANLQNRVRNRIPETAIFWFSGNTRDNDRGAIMCYTPVLAKYWGWYLGYQHHTFWQRCNEVGIHPTEIETIKQHQCVVQDFATASQELICD